jgi:hypothetical protein
MPGPFDRYSLYAARFGGILLRDLFDLSIRSQAKKSVVIPGGDVHPRAIVTCCADPMVQCSTKDLVALFAGSPAVSLQGGHAVGPDSAEGNQTSLLQFQVRSDGGTFTAAGTGAHIVAQSSKGFLYVSEIMARQDDERGVTATLQYPLHSLDGTTSPLTVFDATTLTSSPNFNGIFYLGPVRIGQIGGSLANLPGVQSVSIKSGIDYRSPRADGCTFSINGSIYSIVPEIRIETLDLDATTQFLTSMFGHAFIANTAFNIYLSKGIHGGFRVSDATAAHMVITAQTGDDTTDEISVSGLDDGRGVIVVRPTNGISFSSNQQIL